MGAVGSDAIFVDGTEFVLNQLFGYQSAEAGRERGIRLRDGFEYQHAWDDTSTDDPGGGWSHDWPLGAHVGTIGWPADPSQTQFYGDGAGITNIGSNGGLKDLSQSFSSAQQCLSATEYPLAPGNQISPFRAIILATWYDATGITPGVWYANTAVPGGSRVAYDLTAASGGPWPTIGDMPVQTCIWLSGDFTLHLHFMVVAKNTNGFQWGSGDSMLIRPLFIGQNGTTYSYPSDDISITTGNNFPDRVQTWHWHCHWVGNITSMPAQFYSILWQIQGSWIDFFSGGGGPVWVQFYCMSRGQVSNINSYAPSAGGALLNKAQLGVGAYSTFNGLGQTYQCQGIDSFNMFPIFAT